MATCSLRRLGALVPILAGLLPAQITPPPTFSVASTLKHAGELSNATAGYNSATEQLTVFGGAYIPPGYNAADYHVRINNQFVAMTPVGLSTTDYQWSRTIPMGPTPPPGGWSGWAYAQHYTNPDRITRPVLVELVKNTSNEVMARHRVVLLDKRFHASMETQSLREDIDQGLGFEITSRGLDNLEATLRSAMPQPNLTDFNRRFSNAFAGYFTSQTGLDTTFSNTGGLTPKACLPVNELPAGFLTTRAGLTFTAEVAAAYATYQAADALTSSGSIPGLLLAQLTPGGLAMLAVAGGAAFVKGNSCVNEPPLPAHYELCARAIRGDTRTASIGSVSGMDLQMGTTLDVSPANLLAAGTVANVTGVVDGLSRDMFFRYSRTPLGGCLNMFRPRTDLPDDQVPIGSSLASALQCNGMNFTAANATQSVASTFEFEANSGDIERHRVEHANSPTRIFTLSNSRTRDASRGLCARDGFRHNAEALLDKFFGRARSALDTTWKEDSPTTHLANALDLVFAKWETGLYGDTNLIGSSTGADHAMTHSFDPLPSKTLNDRLWLFAKTNVLSTSGGNLGSAWVYPAAQTFPCSSSGDPCPQHQNRLGNRFDASYTVTTGALNQVLRRLSLTNLFSFNWTPTYQELGIAPPPGSNSTDVAVLNGPNLSQLNANFAVLGPNTVNISIRPTILPFTYINPEPPPTVPEGRENLTYQAIQVELQMTSSAISPLGDTTWFSGYIDFFDPEFDLRPAQLPYADRLVPTLSGQREMVLVPIRNGFTTCTMGPVVAPIQPPPPQSPINHPTCAQGLAASLLNPLRTVLTDRLSYMLSRFPAPVRFDASGQAGTIRNFNYTEKHQWTNSITFYGNLQ